MPKRCLTNIEKGEYVDFQKLRPKNVDQKTKGENSNNVLMNYVHPREKVERRDRNIYLLDGGLE